MTDTKDKKAKKAPAKKAEKLVLKVFINNEWVESKVDALNHDAIADAAINIQNKSPKGKTKFVLGKKEVVVNSVQAKRVLNNKTTARIILRNLI